MGDEECIHKMLTKVELERVKPNTKSPGLLVFVCSTGKVPSKTVELAYKTGQFELGSVLWCVASLISGDLIIFWWNDTSDSSLRCSIANFAPSCVVFMSTSCRPIFDAKCKPAYKFRSINSFRRVQRKKKANIALKQCRIWQGSFDQF